MTIDPDWDPEDLAAAREAIRNNVGDDSIGFLPGSALEKLRPFRLAARAERIERDNAQGVTSNAVTPMRCLQLAPRKPG